MFDAVDPILLARAQFTFTASFHFIFPSFSILDDGDPALVAPRLIRIPRVSLAGAA